MAAIVERQRRELGRLIRRKILARQDPSQRANVVDDRRREIALIERLRAIASDRLKGAREIRLRETLGRLEPGRRPIRRAALAVIDPLGLGVLVQSRRECPEDERAVPIDEEALSGETDRRVEEASPGELAEAAGGGPICRPPARHADPQGTPAVRLLLPP